MIKKTTTEIKQLSIMANVNELCIVSYNMHGFYQGIEVVKDLCCSAQSPDVILLQEHWLTPANLHLLSDNIASHYSFGKSAIDDRVTLGPLVGRPYGGAAILIKNELQMVTECIFCADRYVVVRVGNFVIANVYLPCVGTSDRRHIVEDVLQDIWSWRLMYPDRSFIIGGDFNSDLNKTNEVSCYIQTFLTDHCLARCDVRYPDKVQATYVSESLGHCSAIDYFVCDAVDTVLDYCVLDPDINFSDHLPISIRCKCTCRVIPSVTVDFNRHRVKQLRWDHADLLSYYSTTRCLLYPLYDEIVNFKGYLLQTDDVDRRDFIDRFYGKLVDNVKRSAELHVPLRYKNYYKFWWSEELSCLKAKAIKSNKLWKEAGRPR